MTEFHLLVSLSAKQILIYHFEFERITLRPRCQSISEVRGIKPEGGDKRKSEATG